MLNKLALAAALLLVPTALGGVASADHCYRGYRGHHGGSIAYGVPVHRHLHGHHHAHRAPRYRSYYGAPYRSYYGSPYRYGYGSPYYYGRGTAIGVGRGGVSLYFGF